MRYPRLLLRVVPARDRFVPSPGPGGPPPPLAYVRRREPYLPPELSPGTKNVRVYEPIGNYRLPDPPRQSDVPARPPTQQIAVMSSPQGGFGRWSAESFTLMRFGPQPHARMPLGTMQPFPAPVNLPRTPAMAYGDLFTLDIPAYTV